jgi:Baseplate J-like protein
MNGSCETPAQQLCGCCEGVGSETPELVYNRPGLSQIAYRVGTQTTFKASLLAALSDSSLPALAALRTRDDSDFTIALLDAWAVALDILTFYQERLANESYLDTAVDAASVMYLAQLVGYKPSPGVAASAFLAFTLNDAPGSPANVLIPATTRVQSVPNPGQTPQVFETSGDLTALIELNAIPPQTTNPWALNPGMTSLWLQGTSNNLHVGDALLFISRALHGAAEAGSTSASGAAEFHFITATTTYPNSGTTFVQWDQELSWPTSNDDTAYVYVFRKKAGLFGSQAPDPHTLNSTAQPNLNSLVGWPSGGNGDWLFQNSYASGSSQIYLDATYSGLTPPQSGEPEWAVFTTPDLTLLYQIKTALDGSPTLFTLTSRATQLTLANQQILVDNVQPSPSLAQLQAKVESAVFTAVIDYILGRNTTQDLIALVQALAALQQGASPGTGDDLLAHLVGETRAATAYVQDDVLTPTGSPLTDWSYESIYRRQPGMLRPVEGSKLQFATTETLSTGQPVAIFGKRLRLQVVNLVNAPSGSQPGFVPDGSTSGSQPLSEGQTFLVDAFPPQAASNVVDRLWTVLTTDDVAGTLQISSASVLLVPADKNDAATGESTTISQSSFNGPIQLLSLTQPLARIYDRGTVTLDANVVAATNGETMHEILGSGDATNDALLFTLKQSPLTYLSSSLNLGAVSTLQVWVNNLRWHEVDNFLSSAASDRVFVTQADSTAKVAVQFGNGVEGARTPTGQLNIRAVFRKGIGAAGNVDAGQLSQALDRPQGLKAVTNPDPATGGADPDSANSARTSAPLHTLTLGRVVSLEDYQNYTLAFAGIAKALATWTWNGRARGVLLTVAGANGITFQQDDQTITDLIKALHNSGNPYIPVTVMSYIPRFFEVGANVLVDTDNYDPKLVLAQAWQSLLTNLSFAQRQPGQGVAQSEVIALIQSTPGIIAVELTAFSRQGQPPPQGAPLPAILRAAAPAAGQQGTPQAAEMLLLDPASQGAIKLWS